MKSTVLDPSVEFSRLKDFHRSVAGKRVGVVYGPLSKEDRLYIERSPADQIGFTALMESLTRLGLEPFQIDPTTHGFSGFTADLLRADLIFLNIHGEYGEDGRVQCMLDFMGCLYTGSGVLANAVGLNKVVFKRVVASAGVPTPRVATLGGELAGREADAVPVDRLRLPAIAKPVAGGSSIGVRVLDDRASVDEFL
nr:hypothetical protein [Micromonospora sp. DSM 115978]